VKDKSLDSALSHAKQNWLRLAQFAAFALLSIPFLWPPPTAAADTGTAKATAALISTAVIAILIVAGVRWSTARHWLAWAMTVVILLLAAAVVFMFYDRAVRRFTCEYNHRRVLIGDRLTEQATQHTRALRMTSCSELIEEFAGNVEDIWTLDSRIHASTVLSSLYVAVVGMLASMLVAVTQLLGVAFGVGFRRKSHLRQFVAPI
jgi:hypothetical protein